MNTTQTYRIWCQVSGGITGHREAWLKTEGKITEFSDLDTAQAEASRLNQIMNGPFAQAFYRYSVKGGE